VINAQGELQASETLAQAARMLASEPTALQLRYLQTVTEIAAENNSTTIFPIPIDMITPFLNRMVRGESATPTSPERPALQTPDMAALLPQFKIDAPKAPKAE
jgi:hypothetical protein